MTDPVKVTQLYPKQSSKSELDLEQENVHLAKQPAQECFNHDVCAWFIRYHDDGSWSVATESQAANDPSFSPDAPDAG